MKTLRIVSIEAIEQQNRDNDDPDNVLLLFSSDSFGRNNIKICPLGIESIFDGENEIDISVDEEFIFDQQWQIQIKVNDDIKSSNTYSSTDEESLASTQIKHINISKSFLSGVGPSFDYKINYIITDKNSLTALDIAESIFHLKYTNEAIQSPWKKITQESIIEGVEVEVTERKWLYRQGISQQTSLSNNRNLSIPDPSINTTTSNPFFPEETPLVDKYLKGFLDTSNPAHTDINFEEYDINQPTSDNYPDILYKLTQGATQECATTTTRFRLIKDLPQNYIYLIRSLYENGFAVTSSSKEMGPDFTQWEDTIQKVEIAPQIMRREVGFFKKKHGGFEIKEMQPVDWLYIAYAATFRNSILPKKKQITEPGDLFHDNKTGSDEYGHFLFFKHLLDFENYGSIKFNPDDEQSEYDIKKSEAINVINNHFNSGIVVISLKNEIFSNFENTVANSNRPYIWKESYGKVLKTTNQSNHVVLVTEGTQDIQNFLFKEGNTPETALKLTMYNSAFGEKFTVFFSKENFGKSISGLIYAY